MPHINIDLEDGLEPVSFVMEAGDTERFIAFMAQQERNKMTLERIAKYPETRDAELGYAGCRRLARDSLEA